MNGKMTHLQPCPRRHGGWLGNQRGVTMLELLVASFIGIIVVGSAFQLYLTQHKNWLIQDEITDAQHAGRASIIMLSKHIRMAGHAIPDIVEPFTAVNSNPDTLMVIYRPAANCEAPLEHPMPQPSAELRCDGHDISCFEVGELAYIYDPFADIGEFFVITHVQQSSHIQHRPGQLTHKYPKGSQVFMIDAYRFYVDESDTLHPMLMVEKMGQPAEPYAENIEDLQFRFVMRSGDTLDVPIPARQVREVLIDVVARTDREDLQSTGEGYRRRPFSTEVFVRNLNL